MNDSGQLALAIVSILLWTLWMGAVLYFYRQGDKLFGFLSTDSSKYYLKTGRPRYFTFNLVRNARAQKYLQDLLFKGIPKDFPKNEKALHLAQRARKISLKLHLAFVAITVVIVSFIIFG